RCEPHNLVARTKQKGVRGDYECAHTLLYRSGKGYVDVGFVARIQGQDCSEGTWTRSIANSSRHELVVETTRAIGNPQCRTQPTPCMPWLSLARTHSRDAPNARQRKRNSRASPMRSEPTMRFAGPKARSPAAKADLLPRSPLYSPQAASSC